MENVDSYCKTVWVASSLAGGQLHQISSGGVRELIALRKKLGMPDTRDQLKECELCDNSEFRPGVTCQAPPRDAAPGTPDAATDPSVEAMVTKIAEQILSQLKP